MERPDWWGIESTHFHGPNVMICKIVTGYTRNPLVIMYLPPPMMDHLPYF